MPDQFEQIERNQTRVAWATQHPRLPEYIETTGGVVIVREFERWLEQMGYGNNCPYPSENR